MFLTPELNQFAGHSLGDLEYLQQQYDQQQNQQKSATSSRRTSDVTGRRNFRSKRFSRNLEREPAMRRAQSLHMDRRDLLDDDESLNFFRGHSKVRPNLTM